MWRVWQLFGVRTVMVGLYAWLGFLAIMIHLILLSTDRYNWLEEKSYTKTGSAIHMIVPDKEVAHLKS